MASAAFVWLDVVVASSLEMLGSSSSWDVVGNEKCILLTSFNKRGHGASTSK